MKELKESLNKLIGERDQYPVNSDEWINLNEEKVDLMEKIKPSTKEKIIYFLEEDLEQIPEGIHELSKVPFIDYYVDRRSALEYHPGQRHPIPYVVVKHRKHYFLILRGSGAGEMRLIGRKGCLGGHV